MLQLLVTIQSLVMCEKPYYNEPGHEGTDREKESDAMSKSIRIHNMQYAMEEMLRNPPEGFEEVVKTHFKLKKEEIKERTQSWGSPKVRSGLLLALSGEFEPQPELRESKKRKCKH